MDLLGFADYMVFDGLQGPLLVQITDGADHARRRAKILASEFFPLWIAAGGRVSVWSWSTRGARGERKVWTLREEMITLPGRERARTLGVSEPSSAGLWRALDRAGMTVIRP